MTNGIPEILGDLSKETKIEPNIAGGLPNTAGGEGEIVDDVPQITAGEAKIAGGLPNIDGDPAQIRVFEANMGGD